MTPTASDPLSLLTALLAQPGERQRLITRYLRGDMDASLLAAFEERLLDEVALLDEVEAEKVLRDALRESPQALTTAPASASRWRLPLSVAAGGVFGALLSYALLTLQSAPMALPVAQRVAVAQLPVARGEEMPADTTIAVAATAEQLVLRIPATNEPGPFRLRIKGADGVVLAQLNDIKPGEDGQFDILVAMPRDRDARLTIELEAWLDGAWRQRPTRVVRIQR